MLSEPGPLVGRRRELDQLDAALEALRAGTLSCLAVEGEPGIGKTRLLAELGARADAASCLVLSGCASEFERELPYDVWVDALDAYVASREIDPAELNGELSTLGAVLPSLTPEVGAPVGDARHRTHRAVRRLLEVLSAGESLVLVLDDLHWSDGASIQLIGSLLRRPVPRVLLALGYRTGQAPAALAAALAGPAATVLELEVLTAEECRTLAGAELATSRQAAIFGESGGNPFYALQLARAEQEPTLSSSGDRMATGAGVPRSVAAALVMELEALTPDARLLLDASAVAGDPFEPMFACEIAELDPATGTDALDALLDVRLVRATSVPGRFAFRHPLVRRAVYESVKGGWRLAAHARAAAILDGRGVSAQQRAHHVEQSAVAGDGAAVERLLEAGDDAAPRAPAAAARWFGAALRLLPETERDTRLRTLMSLAKAHGATGDLAAAAASLRDAIDLVPAGDDRLRVRLTASCAASEHFLGLHEQASERMTAALRSLPEETSPEGVTALLALAAGGILRYDPEAVPFSRRALDAARRLGDPVLIGAAGSALAHACANYGSAVEGQAGAEEASRCFDSVPQEALAGHLDAVNRLVWGEFLIERYDEAIRHARMGVAVARATGQDGFVPMIAGAHALSAVRRGQLAAAGELQEEAVETAQVAANDYVTSWVHTVSAHVYAAQGQMSESRAAGERAVELAALRSDTRIASIARIRLAATRCEMGDRGASTADLVEAAGGWEFTRVPPAWTVFYAESMARVDAGEGRIEQADAFARLADATARRFGRPLALAVARRARAVVALGAGEPERALELATESAAEATATRAPIEAARGSLVAGRALAATGDRSGAVQRLRSAELVFDTCGAERDRAEARRELRRLGARAEPHGPKGAADGGVDSLSQREREVADLVTARLTNREVAAELFLSEKTVESHLRNIFVKLGVSSRVEVARAVERGGSRVGGMP